MFAEAKTQNNVFGYKTRSYSKRSDRRFDATPAVRKMLDETTEVCQQIVPQYLLITRSGHSAGQVFSLR